jgi:transcriptional regulator with XRE-family HTH domain
VRGGYARRMEDWSHAELQRLGRAIRAARHELRLSQEEFAERADIHRTYVGMIELGKVNVSWENISRVARGLGVKVSALVAAAGL